MARSAQNGDVVYIVDDDPALLEALKFNLELDGYVVSTFPSAINLLTQAQARAWDCLVVDQKLSGMSGLQLIERLADGNEDVGAILITSNPTASMRARAAAAGVDIVEKPLVGNALQDAIRNVVARRIR